MRFLSTSSKEYKKRYLFWMTIIECDCLWCNSSIRGLIKRFGGAEWAEISIWLFLLNWTWFVLLSLINPESIRWQWRTVKIPCKSVSPLPQMSPCSSIVRSCNQPCSLRSSEHIHIDKTCCTEQPNLWLNASDWREKTKCKWEPSFMKCWNLKEINALQLSDLYKHSNQSLVWGPTGEMYQT